MTPRSPFVILLTLSAVLTIAPGCAARMSVSSHVDHTRDFTAYATYQWGAADSLPVGDARLDEDPYFADRFAGAVERQLAARGLRLSAEAPDLLLHYHAAIADRLDVAGIAADHGYCPPDTCTPRVTEFEAGTLVLDVLDARSGVLIWRGWAQQPLDGVLGNRTRLGALIDEAVSRMLQRWPAPGPAPVPTDR